MAIVEETLCKVTKAAATLAATTKTATENVIHCRGWTVYNEHLTLGLFSLPKQFQLTNHDIILLTRASSSSSSSYYDDTVVNKTPRKGIVLSPASITKYVALPSITLSIYLSICVVPMKKLQLSSPMQSRPCNVVSNFRSRFRSISSFVVVAVVVVVVVVWDDDAIMMNHFHQCPISIYASIKNLSIYRYF